MRLRRRNCFIAVPAIMCGIAMLTQPLEANPGGQRPPDLQLKRPELQLPFSRDAVLRDFAMERMEFDLPVLKAANFQSMFGNNPEVPKSDAALVALARELESPAGRQKMDECGEYEFGLLFAGLSNPNVSDGARRQVDEILAGPAQQPLKRGDMKGLPGRGGGEIRSAEASLIPNFIGAGLTAVQGTPPGTKPTFNRERIVGKFRFLYTDNNARASQNSTLANINATATILNNAWTNFVTNFRKPSHYIRWTFSTSPPWLIPNETIDVECYDLGSGLLGSTSSSWNSMRLCSAKVINNTLKRQTTSVHELFHRVQYAYGYVSGTAGMKWIVEATASWSQKYRAPGVGDWMDRMNSGLGSPANALLGRSYDACHWWVYMGQRAGNERLAVRDTWQRYSTNGKNTIEAVNHTIKGRIGSAYSFDTIVNWWLFANYYKNLATNSSNYTTFSYTENALVINHPGGVTYGPLAQVPRTTTALNVGTNYSNSGSVAKYAARYYVFNVNSAVRRVEIKVTGASANFGYGVIDIKDNRGIGYTRTPAGGVKDQTYNKTYSAGQVTQIAVIVMGIPNGGSFTVTAKGFSS